jgi:nitrite reductase/ring-hydroxylating ferredoxin subunit
VAEPRRVSCGPLAFLSEGIMVRVPIIPGFVIVDDHLGTVRVKSAIVARKAGRIYAYANICRHVPLTLDLGDGDVSSADRQVFLCHHHGARYRIEDGKCLYGPCDGEHLFKLETEEQDGELILVLPEMITPP